MPPSRESERGPALQQELQQESESNEVRVLLVDEDTIRPWGIFPKRIFTRCLPDSASKSKEVPRAQALLPACYNNSTAKRAREALALSFVDEDLPLRVIPERIYARKLCTSTCKRLQVSSLMFGKDYPAADVVSKSRRPSSFSRPHNQGDRTFRKPFRPEPNVARGQGRGHQRGRVPGEHSNQRLHPQGQEDQGRACPLSHCAQSSPVLHFP